MVKAIEYGGNFNRCKTLYGRVKIAERHIVDNLNNGCYPTTEEAFKALEDVIGRILSMCYFVDENGSYVGSFNTRTEEGVMA